MSTYLPETTLEIVDLPLSLLNRTSVSVLVSCDCEVAHGEITKIILDGTPTFDRLTGTRSIPKIELIRHIGKPRDADEHLFSMIERAILQCPNLVDEIRLTEPPMEDEPYSRMPSQLREVL